MQGSGESHRSLSARCGNDVQAVCGGGFECADRRRPRLLPPSAEICATLPTLYSSDSMDWLPNSDGVNYFVREILPLIWQHKPDCTLAIVGRSPSPAIAALAKQVCADPGDGHCAGCAAVALGGESVGCPTAHRWRYAIEDLRSNGCRARATVSTSIGAEGLDVSHPANIRLADTPDAFAEQCLTLLAGRRPEGIGCGAGASACDVPVFMGCC